MTYEDLQSQLSRDPFIPLRLHLVSGKTVEIRISDGAWMLRRTVMVHHRRKRPGDDAGYDVIALRNIERIEQIYGLERAGEV
jgi:hypothetical protein